MSIGGNVTMSIGGNGSLKLGGIAPGRTRNVRVDRGGQVGGLGDDSALSRRVTRTRDGHRRRKTTKLR